MNATLHRLANLPTMRRALTHWRPLARAYFEYRFARADAYNPPETKKREKVDTAFALAAGLRPRHTLEVGCGSGRCIQRLADMSERVLATDIAWNALRHARQRTREPAGVTFRVADLFTDPFPEGPFDLRDGAGMTSGPRDGRKVGVIGVYGKGNLGDEALLLCIADDVRTCLPDAEILAICSDPEAVRHSLGFAAIARSPRGSFIEKLRLVRSCRLLIVGGGTLLCDHNDLVTDVKALASYFFWPVLARLFGVPTIAYAQGAGPATHGLVRQGICRLLPSMADVTFRDTESARLAQGLAGDRHRWPATCDPVVGSARFAPEQVAADASEAVRAWLSAAGAYAVVALRYPKLETFDAHRAYLERSAAAIAAFQASSGAHLVLFPAHISETHRDDRACVHYLETALLAAGTERDRISAVSWDALEDAAAILQNARVAVGDRLHALLLAAMNGVPVVGLAVEDKIGGCLAEMGNDRVSRVLSPLRDDPDQIATAILEAWSADPGERRAHRAAVGRWRIRHRQNIACLERHLANDTPRSGRQSGGVEDNVPGALAVRSNV